MELADELQKMYYENRIPTSVQEDINHISQGLKNGEVKMDELQNKDEFVVEVINQALGRISK